MKNILTLKVMASLTSVLVLSIFILGCGVDENEDFEGLGGESYHPFASPAVDNHGDYLAATSYDYDTCTECHGEDLDADGRSCFECHDDDNHPGPFGNPAVENHGFYLTSMPDSTVYIVNECTVCHGDDLDREDRSCFTCHNNESHPGLMGNVEADSEHDDYFRATGWNMNECVFCHWYAPIYYEPENPPVDFGGNCSASGCHDPNNMGPQKCTTCHGQFAGNYSDTTTWAPPAALDNSVSTDAIGVGAHQSHLNSNGIWAQVACVTCHNVPMAWDDAGHIDTGLPVQADVVFHPVGSHDTGTHSWDHDEGECNAYCHFDAEPEWTDLDDDWNECGECHELPPVSPHPQISACYICHPNVDANDNILDPSLHANGEVETN